MKKKILYTIYSAVFVGVCLAPAALTPFVNSDDSLENRVLTDTPSIKTEDGSLNLDFFSDFDTYFSEHFAFRQQLVTLDGKIRGEVLGTSSNEDVIVGRDGYLFYEPTADDFLNINTLSDRAISNINHNLALLSDYCEGQGATFTFTVAPNKNSIYPEYMPYNYVETDNSGNLEKFEAAFAENQADGVDSFDYCDLKSVLLEAKESSTFPVYHKTDTHWNNIGALAASNALLGESRSFSWSAAKDWSGDLAEMIYPSDVPPDNQYYCDYDFTYEYVSRFKGLDDITIQTTSQAEGKLLMYRDSFGEAILPFMAESFAAAEFSRAVPYSTVSITEGTTVILEIVERNLSNLQKYAPVMAVPEYTEEIPDGESGESVLIQIEESGSYFHIYGELGDEFFKDDSARIFVTVNGTVYEAFNCFEDDLLGREGETSDNGFSLYIPKTDGEELPDSSEISIDVLSGSGEAVKYN